MNKPKFNILAESYLSEMAYGLGNYQSISKADFIKEIVAFDQSNIGAKPISFTSVTNPVYRKTGFPYKLLYKVGQTAGMIGFHYGDNVNAQRARENKPEDFRAQQSTTIWEWLSDSIGVTHRGLTVLRYRPLNPQPSYWVVQNLDDSLKEISEEEAKRYLSPVTGAPHQGLDKEITYRTYGIDKMISVAFQKKEYLITDSDPARKAVFEIVKDKLKS